MYELPSGADIQTIISTIKTGAQFFLPEIFLSGLFLVLILLDLAVRPARHHVLSITSLVGLLASFYFIVQQHAMTGEEIFFGMYVVDEFALFFKYLLVGSAVLTVLLSMPSDELNSRTSGLGEYYPLLVGMTIGMVMMASATDLLMIFLAMEMVSLAAYVLTGYLKRERRSTEAALKYLVYGAVSSGLMIYGFSILYGMTGATNIAVISQVLTERGYDPLLLMVASLMILAGIGYKIGAVPFHFWSPDVYEGAPLPVTAFLSVASKAAGFALLMRFFYVAVPQTIDPAGFVPGLDWVTILMILSVASMIYGNIVALWQTNVKRLLAYSSIAHAGYALLGIIVMDELGTQATLFYLVSYLFMNFGAFLVAILIANKTGSENLEDYRGLGRRMPLAGAAMTVFLISLVGLPPTVGFIGKLMIFSALLAKGSLFIWLALIGILTSVISLYYYMLIPLNMYLREARHPLPDKIPSGFLPQAVTAGLMILTLYFGIFFTPLSDFALSAISIFGNQLF
ncbi:NADH-quinone oxidoreductase subunit N [Prosthecochloris sp. N3]|uniref:NADH-quinone oxidoreductase subunit N n=1 Tax=Prosthecochloris ethylica TaxID=2743976 RepID=A0ABR9XSF1_9CHLB|nr:MULTISPECIES: NADH-quinone oxidoreductase subunit N [Prosthecochloris]MBF0586659.1 NADH-quinone oxidoreductase subunit N [Prosthecochloris ethylica]MBF0636987.1 NADH-quinone oxidoreductase subunit N [Prosthecochloris ethylica]NUK47858.1 NADH-quinone oxidoreductase subunit N [Prosthecochloris ethylica]RNA65092.1 NADH-quinone oxidoreductase subunit N [Prosthecochloris sp. ZM_2]